jgi:hypothetical protein
MARVVVPLLVAWVKAREVGPRCEGRVPRVCPLGSLSQPVCLRGGGGQFWELRREVLEMGDLVSRP